MFPGGTKDFPYDYLTPWSVQPDSERAEGTTGETEPEASQGVAEASRGPAEPPSPTPERSAADLAKDLFGDSNLLDE